MCAVKRDDVRKLQSDQQTYIRIAANYYGQKQQALITQWQSQYNFEQLFDEKFFNSWGKVQEQIRNNISTNNTAGTGYFVSQEKEIMEQNYKEIWSRQARWIDKNTTKGISIEQALGHEFEPWAANYLTQAANSKLNQIIDTKIDEILEGFIPSGKTTVKGKGFLRSSGKDIASDITFGRSLADNESELTIETKYDVEHRQNTQTQFIEQILASKQGKYGLQLKNWDIDLGQHEYATSTYIRDTLNEQFKTKVEIKSGKYTNKYIGPKEPYQVTWNQVYAQAYANTKVAQYLLQIVGPLNIGLVTGTKFYWMSDIIKQAEFFMRVYPIKMFENNEIFPSASQKGTIYINMTQKLQSYDIFNSKQKKWKAKIQIQTK